MLCEEVMKRDVECISPREPVEAAARQMRDYNVGFLPVCDQTKKVVGTITDRDIAVRLVAERKPASTFVEDVMTREVVSCGAQDDLQKAEQLMAKNHKSRIMCLDGGGKLIGVISLSDIAQREQAAAWQTLREISSREAHA